MTSMPLFPCQLLGEGAFSKVKLGTHASTKAKVAVKIVDKDSINNIKDLERVMPLAERSQSLNVHIQAFWKHL